ncbi:MAG: EAL domain-containing protein [Burkholderiales bacterium]|nr:EAL domain-containing protein [Burkholderiales bacterium]
MKRFLQQAGIRTQREQLELGNPIWFVNYSILKRYFYAFLAFAVATFLRWILMPLNGGFEFITYYPTVLIVAILFGAGPGLMTVIFSIVAANYFFMPPQYLLKWTPAQITPMAIFGFSGLLISILTHRTYRYAMESQKDQKRLQVIYDASPDAILIIDAKGKIIRANHQVTTLFGYSNEEVIGEVCEILMPQRFREGHPNLRDQYRAAPVVREMGHGMITRALCKDGHELDVEVSLSPIQTDEGWFVACAIRDITARKRAEAKIEELAFYDQLTGLPNRTLFMDRLNQTMHAAARNDQHGAVLFIDLDNFKTLNDTLGHDVGDELLKQIAGKLRAFVSEDGTVARLGGDEFVVVLAHLSGNQHEAAIETEAIAKNIVDTISDNYQLGDCTHRSSASIGITLFKGKDVPLESLLKQADLTMYRAKSSGRNTVRFFDPAMETAVNQRVALEADIRQALQSQQFLLHYQVQIVGDQELIGAEVLLRWQHPQRGLVQPGDFIPMAEETGLILPLGLWVLETACQQLALWARHPTTAHLTLAVNVSALQIKQHQFVDQVLEVLERTGANPQRLKLELTESLLVDDIEDIIQKMVALKAKGVGFSLDDFGTGYSSLTYLKRLPLDQLKIDRSFVQDVLIDPNDAAIAKTIVALADKLGFTVIAEGVETKEQKEFLIDNACYTFQGFLFGRPLPLKEFEVFIKRFQTPVDQTKHDDSKDNNFRENAEE